MILPEPCDRRVFALFSNLTGTIINVNGETLNHEDWKNNNLREQPLRQKGSIMATENARCFSIL